MVAALCHFYGGLTPEVCSRMTVEEVGVFVEYRRKVIEAQNQG